MGCLSKSEEPMPRRSHGRSVAPHALPSAVGVGASAKPGSASAALFPRGRAAQRVLRAHCSRRRPQPLHTPRPRPVRPYIHQSGLHLVGADAPRDAEHLGLVAAPVIETLVRPEGPRPATSRVAPEARRSWRLSLPNGPPSALRTPTHVHEERERLLPCTLRGKALQR